MERAVLFFDIDGTVISDDTKKVPESAARALHPSGGTGERTSAVYQHGKDYLQCALRGKESPL